MKGRKRFIGILICICMVVGIWQPTVLSNAKSEVTTSGLYNTSSYVIDGENIQIYYVDDFSDSVGYNAALGSYAENPYKMPWDAMNQNLCYTNADNLGAGVALFNGLTNASAMQNYTIEADVTKGEVNQYAALIAYGSAGENGATNGYEFALVKTGTNGTMFRLGYRKNGAFTTLKDAEGNNLQKNVTSVDGLGITTNVIGEKVTMRMSAVTNASGNVELKCYAAYGNAEVLVFECEAQGSVIGITCGAPGFRTQSKGTTIDNINVIQTRDTIVYYEDDFSTSTGYNTVLGSYAENPYKMPWDATNQNLCYTNVDNLGAGVALFSGLTNASAMQNYTIEADVTKGEVNQYAALIAYGSAGENGATNGYEFALVKTGTNGTMFRLGYRKNGAFTTLKDAEGNNLQKNVTSVDGLGITTNVIGEKVTMRMSAVTNASGNVELKCYAAYGNAEVLVFECEAQGSVTGITCGAPGFRTQSKGTIVDNMSVTRPVNDTILYADELSGWFGYKTALGSYAENPYKMPWDATNQNLCYTNADNLGAGVAFFSGLTNASAMQNYTIEADVTKGEVNQYAALIAYGSTGENGATNGYEFALVKTGTNGTMFRLGYRKNGAFTTLKDAEGNNLQKNVTSVDGLGITTNVIGEKVTMRMSAVTNASGNVELKCYAAYGNAEVLVFECEAQGSVTGITCGAPGFRTQSKGTIIDSILVEQIAISTENPEQPEEPEKESGELPFEEKFDDAEKISNRWNNGTIVTIENGQALLGNMDEASSNMYLTGVQNVEQWKNYVYEADVTPLETLIPGSSVKNKTAAIVAAANGDNKGYEFALLYTANNKRYQARLYDRITGTSLGSTPYSYTYGETLKMKMVVTDNTITCYIDGEEILQAQVNGVNELSGTIGIFSSGAQAKFDNLLVTEYKEVVKESGELPFKESFDDLEKVANRWDNGSALSIQENQALLGDKGEALGRVYLTGVEDVDIWKNYVYEAEVTPLSSLIPNGAVNKMTAIVAAANGNNEGYEFGVLYNVNKKQYQVRLYDRKAKTSLASAEYYFQYDVPLQMKMIVTEDIIQCYIDGEQVLKAQVPSVTELAGTIGILTSGNQALFDNLSVTEFSGNLDGDKIIVPTADGAGFYYFDNFSKGVKLVDNKWANKVLDISNDRLMLSGNVGTQYLTGDPGYLLLENYTVAAEVKVDVENDVHAKTIIGSIVARTTGESSGYEFGICYSGTSTYLRLYDRTAKKELARNTDIKTEIGKEYLLTMVCEGKVITCYLDNEKAFSVVDNTNETGTAGVRTIGKVYYDDFVLAVPEYAERLGYVSNGGSPSTGDNSYDMNVLLGMLAISLFCIVTIVGLRKKKEGEENLWKK